jgi:hypothetical protein
MDGIVDQWPGIMLGMPRLRPLALAPAALLWAACTPTLDWREVRPEGSGALVLMPCKPSSMTRNVRLAGGTVALSLSACSAGGSTWAIGFADVGDPTRVTAALDELESAARANLAAGPAQVLPMTVAGATPNPASKRVQFSGRLGDGTPVQEQVAVFVHGTRVFQATVLGPQLPAEDVETFFGSLRTGS